jgi:hypothetical protein
METVKKLPTDEPAFDREVVFTVCCHGALDLCMICVDNPELGELAEMVAQERVDSGLLSAVADRCVPLLMVEDDRRMCEALRCLVAVGETKRIGIEVMDRKARTEVAKLRNCILVIVVH